MALKILFLGTPDHGACFLKGLLDRGRHQVVGVVLPVRKQTAKWEPRNLFYKLRHTIQAWRRPFLTTPDLARKMRIPLWEKELINPAFAKFVTRISPDLFVVASFTRILKPATLSLAPLGVINVHPSLLPKYRGADPIFWAIINNEKTIGVTIHWMDAGVDTGPILMQREVAIQPGMDGVELTDLLTQTGILLLNEALDQVEDGIAGHKPQDERNASYFPPASKEFRTIHWEDCADKILRLVRASTPYGGAFALLEDRQVKVLKAQEIERSPQLSSGKVFRYEDNCIDVSCQDAILRLFLVGGKL